MPISSTLGVVLQPEIQKILDSFAAVLQIHVVFFSASGEILVRGRGEGNCAYCNRVQRCFGLQQCLALDKAKLELARRTGECQVYQCHGGLWEAVMPLLVADRLLGYVMFGQFRQKGDKAYEGASPADVRAFRQCPVFSTDAAKDLSNVLSLLVDYMARHELVRTDSDYFFSEIKQYIDLHYQEDLRLSGVARYLGRSVSFVSHYLQTNHACTFKQLLIERRIRHVEDVMKGSTSRSMKEVCLEAGFNDPAYFSRVYRSHRQKTFSEFLGK